MVHSPIQSHHGHRSYIHFVDDFSCYTWLYPLKHKEEAIHAFKHLKALVKNQFDLKLIILENASYYSVHVYMRNAILRDADRPLNRVMQPSAIVLRISLHT